MGGSIKKALVPTLIGGLVGGPIGAAVGYGLHTTARVKSAAKKAAQLQAAATTQFATEESRNKAQTLMLLQKRRKGVGEVKTRETILTSPLGVVGTEAQTGKTLLGQ